MSQDFQHNRQLKEQSLLNSPLDTVDLVPLLRLVWQKKIFIMLTFMVGFLVSAFFILSLAPRYTAYASIIINENIEQYTPKDLSKFLQLRPFDSVEVLTEIEILKSRPVAIEVIKELNLINDPEFGSISKKFFDPSAESQSGFRDLSVDGTVLKTIEPEIIDHQLTATVDNFLSNLKVFSTPGSLAVKIGFTSSNPQKSTIIVNRLIHVYSNMKIREQQNAQQKLEKWLEERLRILRAQTIAAETKIYAFKKSIGFSEGNTLITSEDQIKELNDNLIAAQQKRFELETYIKEINKSKNLDSLIGTKFANNDIGIIKNLRLQETELKGDMAELSGKYGPKHPKIKDKQSEIADLQRTISAEEKKIENSLKAEINMLDSNIADLKNKIETGAQNIQDNVANLVKLQELERDADSSKLVLKNLLESFKRSSDQLGLQDSKVKIISPANTPTKPSYPNKMLFLCLSAFLWLFISVVLSFLLEKFKNKIQSEQELDDLFGLPCYVTIPKLNGEEDISAVVNHVLAEPSSKITEAIRSLRVALKANKLETDKAKAQTTIVTSSFEAEGKTTLACWLALLSAKAGEKVLLIDANLRNPGVHTALQIGNSASLVDFLAQKKNLNEVIQKNPQTGLHIITAQSVPNNAFDLLSSAQMKNLLESVSQIYDLVIIDTPGSYHISDSKLLSEDVYYTIFVVDSTQTSRDLVSASVKHFYEFGNKVIGFALNKAG